MRLGVPLVFLASCAAPPAPPPVVQIESAATSSPVAPAAAPAAPPPAPSENAAKASGEGQSTGIPECDEYIKALDTCAAKHPAMKAAEEQPFEVNPKAWKEAAKTPQGSAGLGTGCSAARDALKQSCP
jgi:hypothetical protein